MCRYCHSELQPESSLSENISSELQGCQVSKTKGDKAGIIEVSPAKKATDAQRAIAACKATDAQWTIAACGCYFWLGIRCACCYELFCKAWRLYRYLSPLFGVQVGIAKKTRRRLYAQPPFLLPRTPNNGLTFHLVGASIALCSYLAGRTHQRAF